MASANAGGTASALLRGGLVVGCAAVAMLGTQPAARAHPHPSGSIDRVTPGVVRIETSATVDITLLDDRAQLRQMSRRYTVPLEAGSGFTAAPEGVIATATGVVRPGADPRVYAANRIVAEYFDQDVPDDFARHQVADAAANGQLQRCYPPYADSSACLVEVTPQVTVFPNTDPPAAEGLPATVVRTGQTPQSAAVVKVTQGTGGTLPTVPVAAALPKKITSLNIIAYTGRPAADRPPQAQIAHFDPPGSRAFKQDERSRLTGLLGRGADGGVLVDNTTSDVVALLTTDERGELAATPVEEIRSALTAAGTTVRRGPVDVVYETALAHYHTRRYGNSIPVLQQVLRMRPDHAVAAEHLRTAKARRGTSQDAGRYMGDAEGGGGLGWWPWAVAGTTVAAGVAAGLLLLLLRRRVRPAGPAGGPRTAAGPPSGVSRYPAPGPAAPNPHRPRTGAPHAPEPGRIPPDGGPAASGGSRVSPRTGPTPPGAGAPRGEGTAARAAQPTRRDTVPAPSAPAPAEAGAREDGGRPGRFCTRCGMRLGRGHQFCGFCGHPVDV